MNQTLPKVGKTISYLLASFCHDFHSLMAVFTFSYLRDLKSIVTKQWKTFITGDTKCHKRSYFTNFIFHIFINFHKENKILMKYLPS